MTTSKYSYLEYISLAIKSHAHQLCYPVQVDSPKSYISYYLAVSIHRTLLTQPFLQCEVQSGYFECAYSFIDYQHLCRELRPGNVRQTSCSVKQQACTVISRYAWITIIQEQVLKYISVQHHRLTQTKEIHFIN